MSVDDPDRRRVIGLNLVFAGSPVVALINGEHEVKLERVIISETPRASAIVAEMHHANQSAGGTMIMAVDAGLWPMIKAAVRRYRKNQRRRRMARKRRRGWA